MLFLGVYLLNIKDTVTLYSLLTQHLHCILTLLTVHDLQALTSITLQLACLQCTTLKKNMYTNINYKVVLLITIYVF